MISKKKVVVIFGTRPEAIKLAPVIHALKSDSSFAPIVVVTAQHRDMLDQVLKIFRIKPDYDFNIMTPNQTLSQITSKCLIYLQDIIKTVNPCLALVQGDTTTAMTSALAFFYNRIPVGHVEAGLRTSDKYSPFPEEINRRIITPIADLNFCPTEFSKKSLLLENIPASSIYVTGNTVIDAINYTLNNILPSNPCWDSICKFNSEVNRTILVTAHRRESFGKAILDMCLAIKDITENYKDVGIIFPVHPNPNVKKPIESILGNDPRILLLPPLDYPTLIHTMKLSYIILTDSGGIQEEAPSLKKPVLVMREKTERPEGVDAGVSKLVGTERDIIKKEISSLLVDQMSYASMVSTANPYGDGTASLKILQTLKQL